MIIEKMQRSGKARLVASLSRKTWAIAIGLLATLVLETTPAWAEDGQELLEQARAAYQSRHLLAKAKLAVELYGKAIDAGAGYDALWEGARSTWFLGEFPMKNNTRRFRVALFDKGKNWAQQATKARPNAVEGIFWHGVMIGVWSSARGVFKSLRMRDALREAGEKSIRIDASAECGGPYRLLGRYYHKLPGAFGGDANKSISILGKAVKICPQNHLGRIYLAEVLIDEDRHEEARQQLDKIIAETPDPRWSAEHRFVVKQAKTLLNEL